MTRREDIVWAAGLFEGEGSIGSHQDGHPRAYLEMVDEDIVRRFASIMGFGVVYFRPALQPQHSDTWAWAVQRYEWVQAMVAFLWPWLGARRRAKAREVLILGNARAANVNRLKTACPRGHPYDKLGHYTRNGEQRVRRECRRCNRANHARFRARRRAQAMAPTERRP